MDEVEFIKMAEQIEQAYAQAIKADKAGDLLNRNGRPHAAPWKILDSHMEPSYKVPHFWDHWIHYGIADAIGDNPFEPSNDKTRDGTELKKNYDVGRKIGQRLRKLFPT